MEPSGNVNRPDVSHAKRNLIIVGVGVALFVVLTAIQQPADRGLMAVLWAFVVLAPTLLLILVLSKGDRDAARQSRLRAGTIMGRVVASTGYKIEQGVPVLFTARGDGVNLVFESGSRIAIPLDGVVGLAFGGPGVQISSVSVFGSAVDVGPIALGSGSASVKTVTNTFVHVTSASGGFTLYTDEASPTDLEAIFADALLRLRHRRDLAQVSHRGEATANRVDELERLAALRASGALSDAEYAQAKERVLRS